MPMDSASSSYMSGSEDTDSRYDSERNAGARIRSERTMADSDDEVDLRTKLQEAQKKIKELTDEVQRLLVEKVTLQTEISQLKFELAGKSSESPIAADLAGSGDFEVARVATKARTELAEKDKEIGALRQKCIELEDKFQQLKYRVSVHNDQMSVAQLDKKKKTWWGGTKKPKSTLQPSPTLLVTDDMDVITQPLTPPAASKSSAKNAQIVEMIAQHQNLTRVAKRHADKVEELNQRIIVLEREKAKVDAEAELLEKERKNLQDKITKLESIIESLKTQQRVLSDPDRIGEKGITLQLPSAPGTTDADRWKSMVQIQEAALRKVSTQKEELERQLAFLANMHGDPANRYAMNPEVSQLREDLVTQSKLLNSSRKEAEDLSMKLKSSELKEKYLLDEIKKAKSALMEYEKLLHNRAEIQRKHQNAVVSMLGAALADNEVLQETAAEYRQQHHKDVASMHGEIRALRQGRAGKMKGEGPSKPVFPSPAGQGLRDDEDDGYTSDSEEKPAYHYHLHKCDKPGEGPQTEVISSASSSTSEQPGYDSAMANQYHYEWVNGAYVLRQTPTPVITPAPPPVSETTLIEVSPNYEAADSKDQQVARDALRTWNATPPRRQPASQHA